MLLCSGSNRLAKPWSPGTLPVPDLSGAACPVLFSPGRDQEASAPAPPLHLCVEPLGRHAEYRDHCLAGSSNSCFRVLQMSPFATPFTASSVLICLLSYLHVVIFTHSVFTHCEVCIWLIFSMNLSFPEMWFIARQEFGVLL